MHVRIKPGEVATDLNYFWQPIDSCPRNVKVQLRTVGGVALYGKYNGRDPFYTHWAPIPRLNPEERVHGTNT